MRRPLALQGLDDVLVVDDLAEHVVGPVGAFGQEPVGELERLADAEAVAQGFGQDDLHGRVVPDAWHSMRSPKPCQRREVEAIDSGPGRAIIDPRRSPP